MENAYAFSPNAPTSLTATTISSTQINLSWTAATTFNATGGTITTSSGNQIHTFTSSGTFTPNGNQCLNVLIIAGGGGASTSGGSGGGGSGGVISNSCFSITAQAYSIIIGSGGGLNSNGGDTTFSTLDAIGGGHGGNAGNGASGGSGGGGGNSGTTTGGTGTAGQGHHGGGNGGFSSNNFPSGGGAGATASGGNVTNNVSSGAGGNGFTSSISGSSVTYAGGAGGAGAVAGSDGADGTGATNAGGGGKGNGGHGSSNGIAIIAFPSPQPSVTGYKIERSLNNSTWNTIVANTGSIATTYSDTGLSSNTQYYYRVSAINSDGTGSASNIPSATTLKSTPAAPVFSSLTPVSASSLVSSWLASVGANWYLVDRASPSCSSFSQITNTTSLTFTDTGLTSSTKYCVEIFGGNASGTGSASSTKTSYTLPISPSSLSFANTTDTTTTLLWIAPVGGNTTVNGYEIEDSLDGITYSTLISNTGNTNVKYIASNLISGTLYYFRVSTIDNTAGISLPLTPASVTTTGTPPVPPIPPNGAGSSGSSSSPTQSITPPPTVTTPTTTTLGTTLISVLPKSYQLTFGTTLPQESFQFSWNSSSDLYLTNVQVATSPIHITIQTPLLLKGNAATSSLQGSTSLVPFVLTVPAQCSSQSISTQECANPSPIYNVPITFTLMDGNKTAIITSNVSVDLSRNPSATIFVVVISVAAIGSAGFVYRKYFVHPKSSHKKSKESKPDKEIEDFIKKVDKKSLERLKK